MADDVITIRASMRAVNEDFEFPEIGKSKYTVDQAVKGGGVPGTVDATTAAQGVNVDLSLLTALGYCYIKNLDLTNFVTYGPVVAATLHPFGKLKPGETGIFRLNPGITMAVKADTATCRVQIFCLED